MEVTFNKEADEKSDNNDTQPMDNTNPVEPTDNSDATTTTAQENNDDSAHQELKLRLEQQEGASREYGDIASQTLELTLNNAAKGDEDAKQFITDNEAASRYARKKHPDLWKEVFAEKEEQTAVDSQDIYDRVRSSLKADREQSQIKDLVTKYEIKGEETIAKINKLTNALIQAGETTETAFNAAFTSVKGTAPAVVPSTAQGSTQSAPADKASAEELSAMQKKHPHMNKSDVATLANNMKVFKSRNATEESHSF